MNREKLLLAAGCAALLAAVSTAQTPSAPSTPQAAPQFKNLQVFPKDIPRDQLIADMKFFSQSLGVRCTHCHAGVEGQKLDFASDARPEKQAARKMLTMVHRINSEQFGAKDFKDAKVTCFTCHRGATKPLTAPPPASPQPPAAT